MGSTHPGVIMKVKKFQERSFMKVAAALVLASVFLFASGAYAELYQWVDEEGTVYITDSMERVPQEYRSKVQVHESSPAADEPESTPAPDRGVAAPSLGPDEKFYGGHPEEWWRQAFRVRREQILDLATRIDTEQRFVETFEAGRRFGQIFDADKVDAYEFNKEQLPKDRERLQELKDELEKLRKEAASEEVPREIWEEKKK